MCHDIKSPTRLLCVEAAYRNKYIKVLWLLGWGIDLGRRFHMLTVMGQHANKCSTNSLSLLHMTQVGGTWFWNLLILSGTGKRPMSSFWRKIWTLEGRLRFLSFFQGTCSPCDMSLMDLFKALTGDDPVGSDPQHESNPINKSQCPFKILNRINDNMK